MIEYIILILFCGIFGGIMAEVFVWRKHRKKK